MVVTKPVKITADKNKEFGQNMLAYAHNINIAPTPLPNGVVARVPLPLASKYTPASPAEIAASGMAGGRRRTRRYRKSAAKTRKAHRRHRKTAKGRRHH